LRQEHPEPKGEVEAAGGEEVVEQEEVAENAVQSSPWSAFPDLIQVESAKEESNASLDDESLEGQSSRNPLPGPSSGRSSRSPNVRIVPANQVPVLREAGGAIPKRPTYDSVSVQPPDITSRRSTVQSFDQWRTSRDPSSSASTQQHHSKSSQTYPAAPCSSKHINSSGGLEHEVVNTAEQFHQIQRQLSSMSAAMTSLSHSFENLSGNLDRRLNQLDSRINFICTAITESMASSNGKRTSATSSNSQENSANTPPQDDVIRSLIAQQRHVSLIYS
jgi:hypothetical protein